MIHPTAIISEKAKIGKNVKIGAYTIVNDNVFIGENSEIGAHCELGVASPLSENAPLVISEFSLIRSHSIFYEGSSFGPGLATGHRVTVRERTIAGDNLQIGTLSDLQGHCKIGSYVRLHSNVHIGQKSAIGNYVWIFPYVVLTNDPHPPSNTIIGVSVEDFAVIATMSVILPGVCIGSEALVGAHSSVNKNVAPRTVVAGSPAKFICETSAVKLKDGSGDAYPWRRHFHRGYPETVRKEWLSEFGGKNDD